MYGVTNRDRANWAEYALESFCGKTGQDLQEDGYEEVIGDLIADLQHLCRFNSVSWEKCRFRGMNHFTCEVEEEIEERCPVP